MVKVEESFVPAFKDKAAEVADLLAEPKCDHASVDGGLSFGRENLGKSFGMDDFSCEFEFGFRTNYGNTDGFFTISLVASMFAHINFWFEITQCLSFHICI